MLEHHRLGGTFRRTQFAFRRPHSLFFLLPAAPLNNTSARGRSIPGESVQTQAIRRGEMAEEGREGGKGKMAEIATRTRAVPSRLRDGFFYFWKK